MWKNPCIYVQGFFHVTLVKDLLVCFISKLMKTNVKIFLLCKGRMKTFIRRPGNKTKHLKHIIPLLPKEYNTYLEPFIGTGALFLHLLPEKWIINDLNTDIANIWKLVREDPEYMISEIDKFKKKFFHLSNEEKLKMCKAVTNNLGKLKGKKRTITYLIMVYCSFNGNIEHGNKFTISSLYGNIFLKSQCHIFTQDYINKILSLVHVLSRGKIYNTDYSNILKKAKKGDFVFLDPPYTGDKKYSFKYNKNESLDDKFLIRLKKELEKLDKKGVKWMMTQIDTPSIRNLFSKYKIKEIENKASYNTTGKYIELIITNY